MGKVSFFFHFFFGIKSQSVFKLYFLFSIFIDFEPAVYSLGFSVFVVIPQNIKKNKINRILCENNHGNVRLRNP